MKQLTAMLSAPKTAAPPAVFARQRPRYAEKLIEASLLAAALLTILTTLGIVYALFRETISFLGEVPLTDFLFGTEWHPLFNPPAYGVLPLVTGTLAVTGIALIVAVPLGVGSAIYLSEYASKRTRKTIKPILETLAGVPTVVFGFFALTLVTPFLRDIGINVDVFNGLSGGLVVGILVVPTIASIAEDALSAVPSGLREASYGLGATKYQTSTKVIVPAALSGIVAGVVLGASRAVGETMVVLLAAGQRPNLTFDMREPVETMTAFIAATGKGDIPTGSIDYKTIFAVGALLFVMTFVLNMLSNFIVGRFREEYE
ncbi:MAG: phosphate ABC transporter permease subunit PstC [Actinobacteria bacterium]|nr:phosphate ABC transporter permease subunit PstC [Actinomycetota bacterium]